jgi:ELWxxDGT repeat protein
MKKQLLTKISIYVLFLFVVENTFSQPSLLKDIYPGTESSMNFFSFTKIGDKLLFSADDGINGSEGWLTDGTASGTIRLTENTVNLSNTIYTLRGNGLFKTNGTGVTNVLANFGFTRVSRVTKVNETWFFVANVDSANMEELWKSDGTEAGTVVVKKLRPNSYFSAYTTNLIASPSGTELFFTANDGSGFALWKSDGTTVGTTIVKYFANTPQSRFRNFVTLNGETYFSAYNSSNSECLWKTNGTATGTVIIAAGLVFGIAAEQIIAYNNKLYFNAQREGSSTYGAELWVSDGTNQGTNLLLDINPGENFSNPNGLQIVNNLLIFLANTDLNGIELWVTNGNANDTFMLKDVFPGTNSGFLNGSSIKELNKLFFTGYDGNQRMLWETNGTVSGTIPLYDISESDLPMVTNAGYINNKLLFLKETIASGKELWSYNATLSVATIENGKKVTIYPNPVTNMLTIENPFTSNLQLKVIDNRGQVILKEKQNTSSISLDVSNLSKGLYFLYIATLDGNIQTIKFIKN